MATTTLTQAQQAVRSTVALKLLMAVTGLIMAGYLVAHMYGNLKVFSGQAAFDSYAEHLRELGEPILPRTGALWIIRVVLLASVLAHAYAAVALWRRAARARGGARRYYSSQGRLGVQRTYASFTLRWGGVIIGLFIIWHILDLTTGTVNPAGSDSTPYDRLVASFTNPFVTAFYVLALVLLGMHLRHGLFSAVQTLGQSNRRRERLLNVGATTFAVLLIGGFLLIPFSVLFGVID